MKPQKYKSDLILLLTAAIWGLAFVAQRVGMDYLGAFTYNGVRFALGSLSLIPLIVFYKDTPSHKPDKATDLKTMFGAGLIAGVILFAGASLQQLGISENSAGKAAFITGLYIVIVPIFGIFLKQPHTAKTWISAAIALSGLYLLCVTEQLTISTQDLLELIGAFFWAAHILVIDRFSQKVAVLKLAFLQFITCSILSTVTALIMEKIEIASLMQAAIPLLYGGVCSVGVAYTLQIIGQKNAQPSHAAIILSMETVFAAIGGFIILNEKMDSKGLLGCILMFIAMLLPQLHTSNKNSIQNQKDCKHTV